MYIILKLYMYARVIVKVKCKAQLFLPQYFRVVLNQLGLKTGP